MKILYYVGRFPKEFKEFEFHEIHELTRRGHEIVVFAKETSANPVEYDDKNITVYSPGKPTYQSFTEVLDESLIDRRILSRMLFSDPPLKHAARLYYTKHLLNVLKNESNIDLVHGHFANPSKIGMIAAADVYDIPCTVTAHAYEIFADSEFDMIQRVCDNVDHVIIPSKYNKQYLQQEVGINNDFTIVPATSNLKPLYDAETSKMNNRVLTVANLVEKKGHKYAIEAIAKLIREGNDIEYHIAGTGELIDVLQRKVREENIESYVSFLGHITEARLQQELNEASLFVLPCVVTGDGSRDAMPVVLKEAMACRTACVSTTVSAIPELIQADQNGILVQPRDPEALAAAIQDLLENEEKRQQIAKSGYQTVNKHFDITHSVDRLEPLFTSLSVS